LAQLPFGKNITQAFIRNVRGCLINEQNAAIRSSTACGTAKTEKTVKVIIVAQPSAKGG